MPLVKFVVTDSQGQSQAETSWYSVVSHEEVTVLVAHVLDYNPGLSMTTNWHGDEATVTVPSGGQSPVGVRDSIALAAAGYFGNPATPDDY